MSFESIEHTNVRHEVLSQITEAIREGEYQEGDKLPSERSIAQQISASRQTVREALGILAAVGAVERCQGDGTYITSSNENALNEALSAERQSRKKFEDIFELQQLLEPPVAELVAKKHSKGDLAEVQEALKSMEKAIREGDRHSYSQSDRSFHLNIAKATGNPLIVDQERTLVNAMSEKVWRGLKKYGVDPDEEQSYLEKSLKSHQELYHAIKNGNKARIRSVLEAHYKEVKREVLG